MEFVNYTRSKIQSLLEEVNKLKFSDFPEPTVKESLSKLELELNRHIKRLNSLPPFTQTSSNESKTWAEACQYENLYINRILPVLGFILRSTNVRNAFELYDPVLRLCKRFFGDDIRLVFSSEWEFSPLTYAFVFPELSNFVFIGMPVSEAGNGLIVPLVGHEIAHSIWRYTNQRREQEVSVKNCVVEVIKENESKFTENFPGFTSDNLETDRFFLVEYIDYCTRQSIRQCEEEFCDFIGCRIFGESYLDAFRYLLAPGWGTRSALYLDLPDRAKALIIAAENWGLSIPQNYADSFLENPLRLDKPERLRLQVSDGATQLMLPKLMKLAEDFCSDSGISQPDRETSGFVLEDFKVGVPSDKANNFVDIINAGWSAMKTPCFWNDRPELQSEKLNNLSQLIFKSIEVTEYRQRTACS